MVRGNRRCLCPFIAMTDKSVQSREEPRIISFSFIRDGPSGLSLAEDDLAEFYLEMPIMADIRRGCRAVIRMLTCAALRSPLNALCLARWMTSVLCFTISTNVIW